MEKSRCKNNKNGEYIEADITECLTESELDKLLEHLSEFQVKLPDEDEMDKTIDMLKLHMPEKTGLACRPFSLSRLRGSMSASLAYINKFYVILIGILYLVGYYVTKNNGVSAYKTMLFLAPLPFISGILDATKGREEGMLELEMSCRISARQFAASKLLLAGVYAILLNALLSIIFAFSEPAVDLWRMTFLWLTPFTAVSGVALWITTKIRGYYTSGAFAAVWMIAAYTLCLSPAYIEKLQGINTVLFAVIAAAGAAFLAVRLGCFYTYLSFVHEGNEYIEA